MAKIDPSTNPTLLRQLWNQDNDEQAWRTFLDRYEPLIQGWCRRAGLNATDVEEVSAAVLCTLARAMRTFTYDEGGRFRGWLKKVVENAVANFWRDHRRRPGGRGSGDSDVLHMLDQVEAPRDVDSLVQDLDASLSSDLGLAREVAARVEKRVAAHTWLAYWLTAIEERPAGDVASELGMTVAAVYVAKNRVGKMLKAEAVKLRDHASAAEGQQS
jgi:RNA polymerase sigma-70 factor (ECF subfamily)